LREAAHAQMILRLSSVVDHMRSGAKVSVGPQCENNRSWYYQGNAHVPSIEVSEALRLRMRMMLAMQGLEKLRI
jgi:hypothetical protein